MLLIVFITIFVMVNGRPQTTETPSTSSAQPSTDVEIQKHDVVEIPLNSQRLQTPTREIEENTREILRKIDEVNRQQNLKSFKRKPMFNYGYYRTGQDFKIDSNDRQNTENEEPIVARKIIQQQTFLAPVLPLQFYQNYPENYQQAERTVDNVRNIVEGYYPYAYGYNQNLQRQQWQWPFAQYFPIVIKDPLVQMVNAITSWIEYGPQACNSKPPKKSAIDLAETDDGDIENLTIPEMNRKSKQLTGNDKTKQSSPEIRKTLILNSSNPGTRPLNYPLIQSLAVTKEELGDDRNKPTDDDELEEEKAENLHVSNEGNKKLFSKDNTGSGIFIQRIKVRKGGVAIAGPGGIATAGSGGTAIVGPNGFAYTQPNSLAIAGSGSKVVAVEPNIDLNDLINNNSTSGDDDKKKKRPARPPRIGKVVAVGPVIYYNRG